MKIILAQGNPGAQYASSRHNVGFLVLDQFADKHQASFATKPKFVADIAELSIAGEKVLLVKPSTFYNETGRSARAICDFYKCDPTTDLLVVHDDLALPLGTIRTRQKGSDAGNNGIKSLSNHLGDSYHRVRIGIYTDHRDRVDDVDFVLSKFTAAEASDLKSVLDKACQLIDDFLADNLTITTHSHQVTN